METFDFNDDIWDEFKEQNEVEGEIKCDACASTELEYDKDGYMLCLKCHSINNNVIDTNCEWRFYGNEDSKGSDPTRCGMPISSLLPQSSHGSVISSFYTDSYEMRKIRKYHSWNAMPYRERSLWTVFDTLTTRASSNGIPICIIEEAKKTYKELSENRISRGANRLGLIASCIWGACKEKNVPRSAKEIAKIFKLPITNMSKGCKQYQEIMNTINKNKSKKSKRSSKMVCLTASKPDDFIHRFCSNLNMNSSELELSLYVAQKSVEHSLVTENTPPSIAAGSIYLVSNLLDLNISKKDISQSCGTSEVTISKCLKKMEKYYNLLIPENLQSIYLEKKIK